VAAAKESPLKKPIRLFQKVKKWVIRGKNTLKGGVSPKKIRKKGGKIKNIAYCFAGSKKREVKQGGGKTFSRNPEKKQTGGKDSRDRKKKKGTSQGQKGRATPKAPKEGNARTLGGGKDPWGKKFTTDKKRLFCKTEGGKGKAQTKKGETPGPRKNIPRTGVPGKKKGLAVVRGPWLLQKNMRTYLKGKEGATEGLQRIKWVRHFRSG